MMKQLKKTSNMNQAIGNDITDLDHGFYLAISDGNRFYVFISDKIESGRTKLYSLVLV